MLRLACVKRAILIKTENFPYEVLPDGKHIKNLLPPSTKNNNRDDFYIEIANISFILIKNYNINENSF